MKQEFCGRCGYVIYPQYRCLCDSYRNGGAQVKRKPTLEELVAGISEGSEGYPHLNEWEDDSMGESKRNSTKVKIRKLHEDAVIPTYAHEGDAGFDLCASEDVIIEPGETAKVPTGIAVSVPEGYELSIRPRSGITLRTKLRVQYGTVDAGYNGEIGVIVDNVAHWTIEQDVWTGGITTRSENTAQTIDGEMVHAKKLDGYLLQPAYVIRKGDRICQAVLSPVSRAEFTVVDSLEESERNDKGFGSSGVRNTKEDD